MSYEIVFLDNDGYDICRTEEDTKLQAMKCATAWMLDSHRRELEMTKDHFNSCRVKVFHGDDCLFDQQPNVW